jgi:hypothetical protein
MSARVLLVDDDVTPSRRRGGPRRLGYPRLLKFFCTMAAMISR